MRRIPLMNETEWMLTSVLNCEREDLYLNNPELTSNQKVLLDTMKTRRETGEPLQYIIGYCEFMGLKLHLDPNVLIPRPETELMVDKAIELLQGLNACEPLNILDIGTGSGNIAIACAKLLDDVKVTTLDQSKKALVCAKKNAIALNVEQKIRFVEQDMRVWFEQQSKKEEIYDLIISNPPYIPTRSLLNLPEDVKCEPVAALDGGMDGLEYFRMIISEGSSLLKNDGVMFLEFWDGQREALTEILSEQKSFQVLKFFQDYTQTDRFVCAKKVNP